MIEPEEIIHAFTAYEQWKYDSVKMDTMLNEIDVYESHNDIKTIRCRKARKITYSAPYELALNIIWLIQFCTLFIRTAKDSNST